MGWGNSVELTPMIFSMQQTNLKRQCRPQELVIRATILQTSQGDVI